MSEPSKNPDELLDPSARQAFKDFVADLREQLLSEARRTAVGGQITEEDLVNAHRRLCFPTKDSLQFADAQAVISQALRENRVIEWVCYVMAVVLFVFGLVLLSLGVTSSDVATRVGCLVSGSIVELLILVPF